MSIAREICAWCVDGARQKRPSLRSQARVGYGHKPQLEFHHRPTCVQVPPLRRLRSVGAPPAGPLLDWRVLVLHSQSWLEYSFYTSR